MAQVKNKGILTFTDQETGKPRMVEMSLPIETYAATAGWAQDFIRALRERPKVVKWLIRLLVGRYAWRELIGLRDSLQSDGFVTDFPYSLETMDYQKDKVGDL